MALWRIDDGNGTLHRTLLVKQKDGDPFKLARKIISKTVEKSLPNVFFVEDPQFYPKDRAPHGDLKSLKRVLHALESEGGRPIWKVKPGAWKGQVPKDVHQTRISTFLTSEEGGLVLEDHNVWDAVGLGLFALGRSARGGIP